MNNATNKLGWALVGASDIAKTRMLEAINCQPDSQVVAAFSSKPDRAQQYAQENQVEKAYHDLGELLADPEIDVVYISTTNDLHASQAIASAKAGKHVLSEKPLALNLADAREMVEQAGRQNVVLGTNHHLRNAATHRTLRRLTKEGVIGQPLAVRVFHAVYLPPRLQGWRLNQAESGGGVILDITVHDADTLHFILDDNVTDVMARSVQQGLGTGQLEDAVMGVMHFQKGTLAMFHDAFTIKHADTGVEIHGTEASLIGRGIMTQDPIGQIVLQKDGKTTEIDVGQAEDLYAHAVRHFNDAVHRKGKPFATGEDGVRSLAVALAVRESANSGKRVAVQY
ncbi:MAG: Gfo/Idh/MocA family oxidoreductase [Verrucomicrobia bacterium]|nr:Gfo/Idh/MocA family oxidoreductase [Verrucomicrobiota bacterium]